MNTPQSKTSISSSNNKNSKLINPSSSDSPAFHDSPVFNYISNLSPLQPVKAEPGAQGQGFIGLASPPLIFTSPRINSLSTLLNRKLQSSGPNSEFPSFHDTCQKNGRGPKDSAVLGPESDSPLISKERKVCEMAAHCSPDCTDDYLTDPVERTNSSCKLQSDDASQSLDGCCLEKNSIGSGQDVHLAIPAPLKITNKSRISVKVVKNEARQLMPSSSKCQDTLPRLSRDHASATNQTGDSLNEASHLDRGPPRRCLFDENQQIYIQGSEFRNLKDNVAEMQKLGNSSCTKTLSDVQMINHSKPANGSCASPVTENHAAAISKPVGIGLHLNSVVYPRSMDIANGSQRSSRGRVERKNSVLVTTNHSDRKVNAVNVGEVPFSSQERHQNNACSVAASGEALSSDVKNPPVSKPDAYTAVTSVKRKASLVTAESNESNQTSPKKKRKKGSSAGDDDSSKRCNCKKTKCLKLYCDCFAAGFYCGEFCACQGCCNRPDNEVMVIETRQQIESRNPLAFAPKVVQPVMDSTASNEEVRNLSTPTSARHKRGCNCKKSMCLKNYCECFQGKVGCSEGCRCEGCQNAYGKRESFSIARIYMIRKAADEMREAIADIGQECSTVGSNFVISRAHNSPNLTPATPALQCSDLRKKAPESRQPSRKLLQSPDSLTDELSYDENFSTCPKSSKSNSMLMERSTEYVYVDGENGLENREDILESPEDESESTTAHIAKSDVLMIQPSSSKSNKLRCISQPQLLTESGNQPKSSSLRWRSSPITPVAHSGGLEFGDVGSRSKLSDILEVDTPDILKDSPITAKSVKVSSPNKKRVSAPHNPLSSSGYINSDSPPRNPNDSSGSLKICRKFVLRALPTFPSLTPFSKKE